MGANINLPHDVSVSWAKVMPAHFHARFKAIARRYRYVIYNDQIRPAHLNEEITWNHRPLDVARMAEAASIWLVRTTSARFVPDSARPSHRSSNCITCASPGTAR